MSAASPLQDHSSSRRRFARSVRENMRQRDGQSAFLSPVSTPSLVSTRAVTQAAAHSAIPVGRRNAPRLRLSLPAKIIYLYATHRCILIDLSCTGAQVGTAEPLGIDETAILQIAGLEIFCEVVRMVIGDNGGANGLLFDPPLEHSEVLDMRRYGETYQDEELRGLHSEAKAWVDGSS